MKATFTVNVTYHWDTKGNDSPLTKKDKVAEMKELEKELQRAANTVVGQTYATIVTETKVRQVKKKK